MATTPKTVNVHYRRAKLEGAQGTYPTLQAALETVLGGPLGKDARQRIFVVADGGQHKGCLNYHEKFSEAFVADLMHLDGRDVLPTWIEPTAPKPVADVVPKAIPSGEASLGEPAYILVRDNHVAAIERMAFRNPTIERYINALLKAGGQLPDGAYWSLVPKVSIESTNGLTGSIQKLVITPKAALQGESPEPAPKGSKPRKTTSRMRDMFAQGNRVLDMIKAAGGDEAEIEKLREGLSGDLALRARLEISVQKLRQKTKAEVEPDAVHKALAEVAAHGEVKLLSSDGKSDGKLVQLVHPVEVVETGGMIDWQAAAFALTSALSAWAAKKSIDLTRQWEAAE